MNRVVIEETVRRHVTNVAYLAAIALLAIISLGVSRFDKPASVWPSFVTLLAFITGCGPIGPEFSSGTLQLILVKPVSRAVYLLSRVAGVVLVVWAAAVTCALFEVIGRAAWGPGVPWAIIGSTLLNVMADTILTVSFLTLLGSLTRAYFNVALYFTGMAALAFTTFVLGFARQSGGAFGRFLADHLEIQRAVEAINANLYPDVTQSLSSASLAMVLSNAAIALLLACVAFRRREVPYGAE